MNKKINEMIDQAHNIKRYLQGQVLYLESEIRNDIAILKYHLTVVTDKQEINLIERNIENNEKYLSILKGEINAYNKMNEKRNPRDETGGL